MPHVFLSYSRHDVDWMQIVRKTLQESDINVWVDEKGLKLGDEWPEELKEAIRKASCLLVILSPSARASEWVSREIEYALECKIPVYPLLARGTEQDSVPDILQNIQWVNLATDYDDAMAEVVERILPSKGGALTPIKKDVPSTPESAPVLIAVMGAKGGVGKTTFVACAAQLLAESGAEVAVIDFDLDTAGMTSKARSRPGVEIPSVKTIYDHFALHALGFQNHRSPESEALWDVTPEYLRERQLGNIWLLPATDLTRYLSGFDPIANIPIPRESKILEVTEQIITRVMQNQPQVKWILVDCGAGMNPIFSAAFAATQYRYIIILPDPAYLHDINRIKAEHSYRYPDEGFKQIYVVVNRATSTYDVEAIQKVVNPIGSIPRDPKLEEDDFLQPIDFDLGYNEVLAAVRKILYASLSRSDRAKLPNEVDVHIKPWFDRLIAGRLASRTLQADEFRRKTLMHWGATGVLGIAALLLVLITIVRRVALPEAAEGEQIDIVAIVVLVGALVGSIYLLRKNEKKRQILTQLVKLEQSPNRDAIHMLLDDLLQETDRETLHWLHESVKKDLELEKNRRRQVVFR